MFKDKENIYSFEITCIEWIFSNNCSLVDAPNKIQWTFSFFKHHANDNWASVQFSLSAIDCKIRILACCSFPSSFDIFSFSQPYPLLQQKS